MQKIIGREELLTLLKKLISGGRLGSGLILLGPSGVQKRDIAEWIVGGIRGNEVSLSADPDVMVIERERNDKGALKKNIAIEQIRDLIDRLSLTSFQKNKKIGIINEAETLSGEAANALLKTLEDPSGDTLIILLTSDLLSLPQTVVSRCQVINVPKCSITEIASALEVCGAPSDLSQRLALLSGACPGTALKLWQDAEYRQKVEEYEQEINDLMVTSLPEKLARIQEISKDNREIIEERLRLWESLLHAQGQMVVAGKITEALRAINQNANPNLVIEHIFIS